MFRKRPSRPARRQQVMEELIDLDPLERRIRLNRAVADGDVRADEMEVLLRTVGRLDDLRVMAIPTAYRRWPAEELIGVPVGMADDELLEHVRTSRARARRRVAIDIGPEAALVRAARPVRRGAIAARMARARRPVAVAAGHQEEEPDIAWLRP